MTSIDVFNPSTGKHLESITDTGADGVDVAVRRARAAFPGWAATPAHERCAILQRAAGLLREHRVELAELLTSENGKPYAQAFGEIGDAARLLEKYGQEALRLYGETIPGDAQPGTEGDLILTRREPRGVLGAVIPFNSPIDIFAHKVGPALASGNCAVIKPPEVDPLTVMRATELLHEAGVPRDVLMIVNGFGITTGAALAAHPGIDVVSFTGSTAAGLSVAAAAISRLSPVMLELGGNDPLIVCRDADLELALDEVVFGRTLANGQICCANKRLLVHRDLEEDFTAGLLERVAALRVGDPSADRDVELGPLITDVSAERVAAQVRAAMGEGAELLAGDPMAHGNFVGPIVLGAVQPGSSIASDAEVFGPVFPIVSFDDDRQAIKIANDSPFGLNASIFTQDLKRAMYLAHHVQAGTVSVNASGLYRPDAIDYGGRKMSGFGREGLRASFHELTHVKTISLRGALPREASGYPT